MLWHFAKGFIEGVVHLISRADFNNFHLKSLKFTFKNQLHEPFRAYGEIRRENYNFIIVVPLK